MKRSSICCVFNEDGTAAAVRDLLVRGGVESEKIVLIGRGKSCDRKDHSGSTARHFLTSIGIPEFEAGCYEFKVRDGHCLFCVCDQPEDALVYVEQAFEANEAQDVSITIEAEIVE